MNRAMTAMVAIMATVSAFWGLDFVTGDSYHLGDAWGAALSTPQLWGIAHLVTSAIAAGGVLLRHAKTTIFASLVGAATNFMLAVQVADAQMFAWPPEDIRLMVNHLGQGAIWLMAAVVIFFRHGVERRKEIILEEADG